jgi:glycosyltransferase involved in cell wall biosynthesis
VVLYPSDDETAVVAAEPGVNARTLLPYCFHDFSSPRAPLPEPVILFVGGFAHPPNQEAVLSFVDQMLPLIRARVPGVRLAIVGSNPPPNVLALANDAVSVRANVSDAELREAYRTARVAVVPLRYGAGVKLKVVEAMREGLPVVTTSIGAQGLPGLETIASICDDPQVFADAVSRLLTDDALWTERCAAQIDYVASRYSEAAFRGRLLGAVNQSPRRWAERWAS